VRVFSLRYAGGDLKRTLLQTDPLPPPPPVFVFFTKKSFLM